VQKFVFIAILLLLFQIGGAGARLTHDSSNPAWILGQVVDFAARCPELRTERVQEMADAYCPHNRVPLAECENYKAKTFKAHAEAGVDRLKDEFRNADDAQVCRAAIDRYGPNGSQKPSMLSIRR